MVNPGKNRVRKLENIKKNPKFLFCFDVESLVDPFSELTLIVESRLQRLEEKGDQSAMMKLLRLKKGDQSSSRKSPLISYDSNFCWLKIKNTCQLLFFSRLHAESTKSTPVNIMCSPK